MNEQFISFLLGCVEGITEFIPVSSTAHLRIAEGLLHLSLEDGYWKMYSIVIQLGAILCLPVYFRVRIISLLKSFLASTQKLRHPLTLTLISFFATAIPSFLLVKLVGKNLENLHVISFALIAGGIIMAAVDFLRMPWEKKGPQEQGSPIRIWRMEDMTVLQAVVIGLCQVVSAVLPGTSRSMATIAGAQLMGLSRTVAVEFSFFLSMPTMAVATGYVLLKSLIGHDANPIGVNHLTADQWGVLATGFVVSFITAYAAVAGFMKWIKSHGFLPFAIYRIVVGGLVLMLMA